jgi:hypothetical protein
MEFHECPWNEDTQKKIRIQGYKENPECRAAPAAKRRGLATKEHKVHKD